MLIFQAALNILKFDSSFLFPAAKRVAGQGNTYYVFNWQLLSFDSAHKDHFPGDIGNMQISRDEYAS